MISLVIWRQLIALLASLLVVSGQAAAGWREAADHNARAGGVSMVVVKNGVRLFEDYPNGGGPDRANDLASGTKSFSGVLAAAAVKDGLLVLDEKASDTLTEWRADATKRDITIRQILTLTSGLKPLPVGRPPTYAKAVQQPIEALPGTAYEYGPLNFQVFGEIMRRKLQSFEGGRYADPLAYLEGRILKPAGIDYANWKRGADGMPHLPRGASLTAREWAEFGNFVLGNGAVDVASLADTETLAAMFEGSAVNAAYGLSWWLNARPRPETLAGSHTMRTATDLFTHPRRAQLPRDLVMAAGAGGQRLYLIPSRNLAIVRQHPKLFETRFARRRAGDEKFSDVEFLLAALAE